MRLLVIYDYGAEETGFIVIDADQALAKAKGYEGARQEKERIEREARGK